MAEHEEQASHRVDQELAEAHEDLAALRAQGAASPSQIEALEEKLLEVNGLLSHSRSQNDRLSFALQQAKEQLAQLRDEVEKLTQPPS